MCLSVHLEANLQVVHASRLSVGEQASLRWQKMLRRALIPLRQTRSIVPVFDWLVAERRVRLSLRCVHLNRLRSSFSSDQTQLERACNELSAQKTYVHEVQSCIFLSSIYIGSSYVLFKRPHCVSLNIVNLCLREAGGVSSNIDNPTKNFNRCLNIETVQVVQRSGMERSAKLVTKSWSGP